MSYFTKKTLLWVCLVFPTILFFYFNYRKPDINITLQDIPESASINLMTNYPVMFEKPWSENQTETNKTRLRQRQEEVDETLQKNLNHPFVKTVHLLINQEHAEQRLRELTFNNKHKILVHRINGLPKYRDFLDYVNKNLQNQAVVITNMDIYLGEGFEKLNKTFLAKQSTSYALTRSGREEKRCNMTGKPGYCETNYIGSHDTYIFVLTRRLDESVLSQFDYPMHLCGGDNVFIWILKTWMKMEVLNPCKYLKTYHNHCIDIHSGIRPRINSKGKSVVVFPSGLNN